jgi:hypothetical protein
MQFGDTALFWAVNMERVDIVYALIAGHADVNAQRLVSLLVVLILCLCTEQCFIVAM